MTKWIRSPGQNYKCGSCRRVFETGDPICVYVFGRLEIRRCPTCHGAPAPELPVLVARVPEKPLELPFVRFQAGVLPLDWKTDPSGAREPGEDD